MEEPRASSVYHSGKCTVLSYGAYHHELHYDGRFVANFRAFRDAVRYQLMEFPGVSTV